MGGREVVALVAWGLLVLAATCSPRVAAWFARLGGGR